MNITIYPGKLSGTVAAIPSKSQAHRLLICAAFADRPTSLFCPETNRDIEATVACLNALGATISRTDTGYEVAPLKEIPSNACLDCGESGSTLRFLLPVVGALGVNASFRMSGRLPCRPLSPLWEEMERMGCSLSRTDHNTLHCTGKLRHGNYVMDGSISSQFVSGLLFAMAIMDGNSSLNITGTLESRPYVEMTQHALSVFGKVTERYSVTGGLPLISPGRICVEGDWSNAAFFLAARATGSSVEVSGLNHTSFQGDRCADALMAQLSQGYCDFSAADIPDLIPILSVVAAANSGAVFRDIGRLRLKESDRVASTIAMLSELGIHAEDTGSALVVYPGKFNGGSVESCNDHRIAMSAAIAATLANAPVTILDAGCVAKSYPAFWQEYRRLGGQYEQHLR